MNAIEKWWKAALIFRFVFFIALTVAAIVKGEAYAAILFSFLSGIAICAMFDGLKRGIDA